MTSRRGLRPLALLGAWLLATLAALPAMGSRPAFDRDLDRTLEQVDVAAELASPIAAAEPDPRLGLLLAPPYPDTRFRVLGPQPLQDVVAWDQILASADGEGRPKTRVRGFELRLGAQHQAIEEFGLEIVVGSGIYLDPELGRFLSEDPFVGMADTPPSLHRYLYAYANPTVYWDPDGRHPWLVGWQEKFADFAEGVKSGDQALPRGISAKWAYFGAKALERATGRVNTGVNALWVAGVTSGLVGPNQVDEVGPSFAGELGGQVEGFVRDTQGLLESVEYVSENPEEAAALGTYRVIVGAGQALKIAVKALHGDREAEYRVIDVAAGVVGDAAVAALGSVSEEAFVAGAKVFKGIFGAATDGIAGAGRGLLGSWQARRARATARSLEGTRPRVDFENWGGEFVDDTPWSAAEAAVDAGVVPDGALSVGQVNNIKGMVFENILDSAARRQGVFPFFRTERRGGMDLALLDGGTVLLREAKFANRLQFDDFTAITSNLAGNIEEIRDAVRGLTGLSQAEKRLIEQTLDEALSGSVPGNLRIQVQTGKSSVGPRLQNRIRSSTGGIPVDFLEYPE